MSNKTVPTLTHLYGLAPDSLRGTRIRRVREDLGISRDDAIRILDVSMSALTKWETDHLEPSIVTYTGCVYLLYRHAISTLTPS